jgi:hypothetical protein
MSHNKLSRGTASVKANEPKPWREDVQRDWRHFVLTQRIARMCTKLTDAPDSGHRANKDHTFRIVSGALIHPMLNELESQNIKHLDRAMSRCAVRRKGEASEVE